MRNKFAGHCYVCGKMVRPGKGFFERFQGHWRLQHAEHAKKNHKNSTQKETVK